MGATHIRDLAHHVGLGMTFASKTLWRRRAALRVGSWGGAVTGGGRCMLAGSGCSECESDRTVRTLSGRDFDLPRHSHYSGVIPMVFQHSGGRDFDLPRHSHYSGVIPMVFQHSERWAKKTLVQLEGKQGERGPDFDDDGYKYMICVEPAVARPSAPVELAIGESWTEGELLWSFSRELTKSLHEDVMDTCTSMISCGRGCGAFAPIARK